MVYLVIPVVWLAVVLIYAFMFDEQEYAAKQEKSIFTADGAWREPDAFNAWAKEVVDTKE